MISILIVFCCILSYNNEAESRKFLIRNLRFPHEALLLKDADENTFNRRLAGSFSGAVATVWQNGKEDITISAGMAGITDSIRFMTRDTYFDLASLTKQLCTAPLILMLADKGRISLNDNLKDYFKEFADTPYAQTTIYDLLAHKSKIISHYRFFRYNIEREKLIEFLSREKPLKKSIYSDLNYIILGMLLEKIEKKNLDKLFDEKIAKPLNLSITFNPDEKMDIASSQYCRWRRRQLRTTEVHDENAWFWNNSNGHAGLFGNASDIANLMSAYIGYSRNLFFSPFTLNRLLSYSGNKTDIALGFKSNKNSMAAKNLGKYAIGHTGYTGSSIWMEHSRGLVVVLLTNSLHPAYHRNINNIRKEFHDMILRKE